VACQAYADFLVVVGPVYSGGENWSGDPDQRGHGRAKCSPIRQNRSGYGRIATWMCTTLTEQVTVMGKVGHTGGQRLRNRAFVAQFEIEHVSRTGLANSSNVVGKYMNDSTGASAGRPSFRR
jgi:hypothetical protein